MQISNETMVRLIAMLVAVCAVACDEQSGSLTDYRAGLSTQVKLGASEATPPVPPPGLTLVKFPGPLGEYNAYLSDIPDDGKKHPAIVWVEGGISFDLNETPWADAQESNDQSARQYRDAGIVTLYVSTRGTSGNPGQQECFLGEVDDIVAAGEWLVKQPGVDPDRVYIGGHSSGGTLVLLAVQSTDIFRAAFAFGAHFDPWYYDACLPNELPDAEYIARAPIDWMHKIKTPTWIMEGTDWHDPVQLRFWFASDWSSTSVVSVPNRDHFTILGNGNRVVAAQIVADTGEEVQFELTPETLTGGAEK